MKGVWITPNRRRAPAIRYRVKNEQLPFAGKYENPLSDLDTDGLSLCSRENDDC